MAHLGPAKLDAHANSITLGQKLLNLARLHVDIMLVCTGTHTDLFQRNRLLIFTGLVLSLRLLVLITAIVHQFTDRRYSIGRDLNHIKIPITSDIKGTHWGHDSDHFPVLVNQTNLTRTNALIDTGFPCTVVAPKIPVNRPNLPFFSMLFSYVATIQPDKV